MFPLLLIKSSHKLLLVAVAFRYVHSSLVFDDTSNNVVMLQFKITSKQTNYLSK